MTFSLILLVLLAAFLHAAWNLVVKITDDRFLAMFMLQTLMGVMGIGILIGFGMPGQAAWPYAIFSGFLHTGYNLFLARSYKYGDLGLVYPVARGTAPLITLIGSHLFTQDAISSVATIGICVLILGIWLIALSGDIFRVHRATFLFALMTSVFIGCYTIVDGLGGRAAGDASAYTGLVYVLDGLGMLISGLVMRGGAIFTAAKPLWKRGVVGAAMSGAAYWIVIYAMSIAPIAIVAALRETSILFAVAFSARILKEPLSWRRGLGAVLVVAGAMALRG